MDTDQIFNQLIAQTYTVLDMHRRLRILRTLIVNRLFSTSGENVEISYRDQEWIKSLGDDFSKKFTRENVYIVFDSLKEKLEKSSALVIYVPFEMPPEQTEKLGVYLRGNFDKNFLFDVKLDPYLIAGCAMVWKGMYKDYSLRRRIEDRKDEILLSFKGIVK